MATATKQVSRPRFARRCDRAARTIEERDRRRESNGGGQQ